MNDDRDLLGRYADSQDEAAFAELVHRHVDIVYSAALRQLNGDAHLAADATQLVFADLARKARAVARHRVLAGWLFTSTRFATAKLVRTERRRHAREQEAHLMQTFTEENSTPALDWQRVRPVLDDVLSELNERDREAILLRFFEGRDYASVGAQLQLADNTARMRVERALEKLRTLLERRGVKSTSAALATVLASQTVAAAPAGLATTITGAALTGGGAVAAGTIAGTFMSITKLQLGLAGAVVAAGGAGYVIQAQSQAALRAELAEVRKENVQVAELRAQNDALRRTAAEVVELRSDDADLVRLQEESTELRQRMAEVTRAEAARRAAQAPADRIFTPAMLDAQPSPRFQAKPAYPFEMRRAGVGGDVVVEFVVDAEGNVVEAHAARSSRREFEAAAVEAVSKWKFKPGQKGGQAVATRMQVPIVFSLESGETSSKPMTVLETK